MDDILAMLLAFSAKRDELDILMLSLTFGNVEVQKYVVCDSFYRSFYTAKRILDLSIIRGEFDVRGDLMRFVD